MQKVIGIKLLRYHTHTRTACCEIWVYFCNPRYMYIATRYMRWRWSYKVRFVYCVGESKALPESCAHDVLNLAIFNSLSRSALSELQEVLCESQCTPFCSNKTEEDTLCLWGTKCISGRNVRDSFFYMEQMSGGQYRGSKYPTSPA